MITQSAMKHIKSGKIYTGRRHCDCISKIVKDGHGSISISFIQGFIDDKGMFMDRQEAYDHAMSCGQINGGVRCLMSEDLW